MIDSVTPVKPSPEPPIRVLLVGPTMDAFPGGVAIQAATLADRFNDEDGLVRIELLSITPPAPRFLRPLRRIPVVRTIATTILFVKSLIKRIPGSTLVHVNAAGFSSFVISSLPAVVLGRLMGRPVVLHCHNGNLRHELIRFRPVFRWLLGLADLIVVPSRFLALSLAEVGLPSRTVANQVDIEHFPFRTRVPLLPKFVSCRHFEDIYDIPTLLSAFQQIQARFPNAELTLAGKGSRETELRETVAKIGLRNVTFVGQLAPIQMARLLGDAGILLNSSAVDNTPVSLIEAFASGLPIVSTDAGGIPFLVDQGVTGRLVPVGDAAGLAREAIDLLERPAVAAEMTARARAVAEAQFSWPAVCVGWLATYRGLLLNKGA